jgi:hypothetical protein
MDAATFSPGGASRSPSAARCGAAKAQKECPALTAERYGQYFFAEPPAENQSGFPTSCLDVATISLGGASSGLSAAGCEAAEAARHNDTALTRENPGT